MTKRLEILIIFLILAACKDVNGPRAISTVTSLPETVSTTSTLSIVPTATATVISSEIAMNYQCLDIADHPPSDYILRGTLVFNNTDNTDSFLWNNDKKNSYQFQREEGDRLSGFDVSPDRKHIMYQHYSANSKQDRLVIATADGQPIWSQVIDSYLWNWFDNERLISLIVPQTGSPSLLLLTPFSGERQELRTDYPDSHIFSGDWFPSWKYTNGGLPVYDPHLTRAIYPECDSECQEKLIRGELGWPIALWDIEKERVIARIDTMDTYGKTPIWTPDGKRFILATKVDPTGPTRLANEFFIMSRDGQINQLTRFMDQFEEVNIPDNYSLSPDGKLLAFWIVAKPSDYGGANLAIMNIETGEVTNFCIQGDPSLDTKTGLSNLTDPLWSPDNTQLLVTSEARVVLVDLKYNYAAQIGQNDIPVGWMVSP